MLRTLAEMENLRRRTEREVADARTYCRDELRPRRAQRRRQCPPRALESVPADQRATADGALKSLIDGIELTERDLVKNLERHGVKRWSRRARSSTRIAIRRCSRCRMPRCRPVRSCRLSRPATSSETGCCAPALVGVAKGGPKAAPNPADAA